METNCFSESQFLVIQNLNNLSLCPWQLQKYPLANKGIAAPTNWAKQILIGFKFRPQGQTRTRVKAESEGKNLKMKWRRFLQNWPTISSVFINELNKSWSKTPQSLFLCTKKCFYCESWPRSHQSPCITCVSAKKLHLHTPQAPEPTAISVRGKRSPNHEVVIVYVCHSKRETGRIVPVDFETIMLNQHFLMTLSEAKNWLLGTTASTNSVGYSPTTRAAHDHRRTTAADCQQRR